MRTTAIIAMAGVASAATALTAQEKLQAACTDTKEWTTFTDKQNKTAAAAKTAFDTATATHKTDCPIVPVEEAKDANKDAISAAKADDNKKACTDAVSALTKASTAYKAAQHNVTLNVAWAKDQDHQNAW